MTHLQYGRILIFAAVALLATGWGYASTLELRGEKLAQRIATKDVSAHDFTPVPLSAEPSRTAAQTLLAARSDDHGRIEALLADSIRQRPLYAPYWLDRAEAAHRAGDDERAEKYLEIAVTLWPNRPILLWKTAMLRTRMGHADTAVQSLREYLRANPNGYQRALAVAMRLRPDPGEVLPAVLPERLDNDYSRDDIVWRILRSARSRNDTRLGRAAWRELSADARRAPEPAIYYVEWMAALGNQPEALAAWRTYRAMPETPVVENGGFERDLAGGLDWRASDRPGVSLSRDRQTAYSGRFSLKLAFSGEENVHYAHLRQYLPVEPSSEYTLSFAWRGDDITTRSGPFIDIRSRGAGHIAHTEARWGSWDWERRELSFTAPADEHFVQIRVRRKRTDALDNKIGGDLWLDDFRLTAHDTEAQRG